MTILQIKPVWSIREGTVIGPNDPAVITPSTAPTVIATSAAAPGTTIFTASMLGQTHNFADPSIGTYQIILQRMMNPSGIHSTKRIAHKHV